jgi:SIR2-like domain
MATNEATASLRTALEQQKAVPVVGAGFSASVARLPGWLDLIKEGISFAESSGGCPPIDVKAARSALKQRDLVGAAKKLRELLGAPGGQYVSWLDHVFTIGSDVDRNELCHQLADLLCSLVATTNYDNLLEKLLLGRFETVTWLQPALMVKALKATQNEQTVLHLHGVYHDPKSVVLGADNYDELLDNKAYHPILQTLWLDRTLLFIGCSFSGLGDPDFSRMLDWFKRTFPGTGHRHFALMLEGSYTREQQKEWLHELRVQVISYGPTHEALADKIKELNPNSGKARFRRVRLMNQLKQRGSPNDIPEFVSIAKGAGASAADDKLLAAAETLFKSAKEGSVGSRKNFSAMQDLTRSMVDPQSVKKEMLSWKHNQTRYEGHYRETVERAARALFLFEDSLLNALKQRGVQIHQSVLEGDSRHYFERLEKYADVTHGRADSYAIENMNRILMTVNAILESRPDEVFPELAPGVPAKEPIGQCLLVVRNRRLELRRIGEPKQVFAMLPLDMTPLDGRFAILEEREIVLSFTSGEVIAWDPTIPLPFARFSVSSAFGVNCVSSEHVGEALHSIVCTTAGPVYRLENLKETDVWWPVPGGFVSEAALLPDDRIFGIPSGQFRIIEMTGRSVQEALTPTELVGDIADQPILGDHWTKRLAEEKDWYQGQGRGLSDLGDRLEVRFQHPSLGKLQFEGKTYLTLKVALSFHVKDSAVLILDPAQVPLRIVGHFLVENHSLVGFDTKIGPGGQLILVGALLSDFKLSFDLVVWARAAKTSQGIIFVREGSTIRTRDDLVKVAFAADDVCFASDDSGGLFRFSIKDASWSEVCRDDTSRIKTLRFHE